MISKIRTSDLGIFKPKIRQFEKPLLNYSAKNFLQLINFKFTQSGYFFLNDSNTWTRVTEPSITKDLSTQQILKFKINKLKTGFVCHNQAVERYVKQTTYVSTKVIGLKRKVGQALVINMARKT